MNQTAPAKDAAFSSLFCLCSISLFLSAFAGSFEVTVTSVSLPPFVSRRGLSNTNQSLSLLSDLRLVKTPASLESAAITL